MQILIEQVKEQFEKYKATIEYLPAEIIPIELKNKILDEFVNLINSIKNNSSSSATSPHQDVAALSSVESNFKHLNEYLTLIDQLDQKCKIIDQLVQANEKISKQGKEEVIADLKRIMHQRNDNTEEEWTHILHLSDLHFGSYLFTEIPTDAQTEFNDIVNNKLFAFFRDYINDNGRIHIIAITGDTTYQNNSTGYQEFIIWIKELCKILNININSNVIICPGNHESEYTDRSTRGLNMSHKNRNQCADIVLSMTHIGERTEQFKSFNNMCGQLGLSRPQSFQQGVNQTPIGYLFGRREIEGLNFAILNSAWNSFPRENGQNIEYNHGNLFLGRHLVDSVFRDLNRDKITIALFHHPLSWLHESEIRTYGNDQHMPVAKRVRLETDIILNGHIHGKIEPPNILANKTLEFSGGSLYTNDSPAFQFEIISINKTHHYCLQKIFSYNRQADGGNWELESDDQKRYYFSNYRIARELISRAALGEIILPEDIESVLQNLNTHIREAFMELYRNSNFKLIEDYLGKEIIPKDEEVRRLLKENESGTGKNEISGNSMQHNEDSKK